MQEVEEIKAFEYDLPQHLIAQRPVIPYDSAKLLLVQRSRSSINETLFSSLDLQIKPSDILVFNNSKVIPARLLGNIVTRQSEIELLLVSKISDFRWRCIGRPMKKLIPGTELRFANNLHARVVEKLSDQELEVEFNEADSKIYAAGLMPIPPYIRGGKADEADRVDYQTIFAENPGSIAAPTASLHFTKELLSKLKNIGIELQYVTLHIGMASVRPLWDKDDHSPTRAPSEEFYQYNANVLNVLKEAKRAGRRIVAVGTTVVRALESMALRSENADVSDGELIATKLFIKPGDNFKIVDAMITNFHFPRSSHLLLVQAFMGESLLHASYDFALKNNYRFLSYGDAMFIQ